MSEKIHAQHLERKAILYVRQSSPYQVVHNLGARSCSMRWKRGFGSWAGARSKLWTKTWEDPPPGR